MPALDIRAHIDLHPFVANNPALIARLRTVPRRTLARARWDLARLYVDEMRRAIDEKTQRRTGALRAVRRKVVSVRGGRRVDVFPTWPRTAYRTPPGRGRRNASKVGQYAFVVNHHRGFIQLAQENLRNSPRARRIIQRHAAFILRATLAGN